LNFFSTQDDSTPEFLKVKNNLRRTIYEEEDQKSNVGPSKPLPLSDAKSRQRSKSMSDVHREEEDKSKKKGFFSNLFSKVIYIHNNKKMIIFFFRK